MFKFFHNKKLKTSKKMSSRENKMRETGDRSSKKPQATLSKVCFKEKERNRMVAGGWRVPEIQREFLF